MELLPEVKHRTGVGGGGAGILKHRYPDISWLLCPWPFGEESSNHGAMPWTVANTIPTTPANPGGLGSKGYCWGNPFFLFCFLEWSFVSFRYGRPFLLDPSSHKESFSKPDIFIRGLWNQRPESHHPMTHQRIQLDNHVLDIPVLRGVFGHTSRGCVLLVKPRLLQTQPVSLLLASLSALSQALLHTCSEEPQFLLPLWFRKHQRSGTPTPSLTPQDSLGMSSTNQGAWLSKSLPPTQSFL